MNEQDDADLRAALALNSIAEGATLFIPPPSLDAQALEWQRRLLAALGLLEHSDSHR